MPRVKMAKEECPETSRTNPVKAIRLKCLDCSGGSVAEVEKCPLKDCALYPFRFGSNPFRTSKPMSEEQKQILAGKLKAMREAKKNEVENND